MQLGHMQDMQIIEFSIEAGIPHLVALSISELGEDLFDLFEVEALLDQATLVAWFVEAHSVPNFVTLPSGSSSLMMLSTQANL